MDWRAIEPLRVPQFSVAEGRSRRDHFRLVQPIFEELRSDVKEYAFAKLLDRR
jgi:hypothetical protein